MNQESGFESPNPADRVEALMFDLNFGETDDMRRLRRDMSQADPEELDLARQYRNKAEAAIKVRGSDELGRDQIGLLVAMGRLWRDARRFDQFRDYLEGAYGYADGMQLFDLADKISDALDDPQPDDPESPSG